MKRWISFFAVSAAIAFALSQDQLKLLHDPGGWEFITVSDPDSGIQTQHTCFDGSPHPDECSGTLTFRAGGTFAKDIYIHHQKVQRHGKYELQGDQLTFYDEFGTRDGPYTVAIDTSQKTMTLDMPQIHIGLELETAYRKALQKAVGKPAS